MRDGAADFLCKPFDLRALRAVLDRLLGSQAIRRPPDPILPAVAAAHASGVVHRDVKPEYVLMSGRHAWVADFGVAMALWGAVEARGTISRIDRRHDLLHGTRTGG